MPKQEGQKTKLLALLHIFEQKTDENHLLNVPQLVELLEQQGILAERKSTPRCPMTDARDSIIFLFSSFLLQFMLYAVECITPKAKNQSPGTKRPL